MKRRICATFIAISLIIGCGISVYPFIEAQASYVDDFLQTVGPMCTEDMRSNRILASFTMAQAIYESGWGRSTLAVEANNLFGMRAYSSWTGKVYDKNQGVLYNSWDELVAKKGSSYVSTYAMSFWRAFDNWQESVNSHSELFNTSSRYSNLRGNYDYKSCCKLVVEDGYCTDSGYTENLIQLIENYNLEQYNYNFAANGEDGSLPSDDEELTEGKNLFDGLTVNYYLKGKWSEFFGTTPLPTDGAYRGDGMHNWNGNSAVSGVTFDTADYNNANATANFFVFELEDVLEIDNILIRGYREDGNRSYATLEVFASENSVTVDANSYETVTDGMTKLEYNLNKLVIKDAPQSAGVDQFFNLILSFTETKRVKTVLIKTNANYTSSAFFQFDEIAAYAPKEEILPFTLAEGVSPNCVTINTENAVMSLNDGVMTAKNLLALFCDTEINIKISGGDEVTDNSLVSTGNIITSTINDVTTSLTLVVCGDINGDAVISSSDYIALRAYIKGSVNLSVASVLACDLDNSKSVSSVDYLLLKTIIS